MKKIIFILMLLPILMFSAEVDMKYHKNEQNISRMYQTNDCPAVRFEPTYFDTNIGDYKFIKFGFRPGNEPVPSGQCDIYVTFGDWANPNCNSRDGWSKAKYVYYGGSIVIVGASYDDIDVSSKNWTGNGGQYFWLVYHVKKIFNLRTDLTNHTPCRSLIYEYAQSKWNTPDMVLREWWCHCVISYTPTNISNTSIGIIRTLFK